MLYDISNASSGTNSSSVLGDEVQMGRVRVKVILEGSIFEVEDELEVVNNNQLATVQISNQYELEMQVKLLGMGTEMTNIISIGGSSSQYGSQNPAIWLEENSHTLIFATALDNDPDHDFDYELDTPDKWTDIRVTQLLSTSGDYIYRLFVNQKQIHEKVNNVPVEIENAKVWLSNLWAEAAPAKVRNFKFVSHDCPANKYFDGKKCADIGMWQVIQ